MKKVDEIFSDKFINKTANKENILLISMYRFAYPFTLFLNKIKLSPNQVTVISLVSTILACNFLIFHSEPFLFSIFWGFAILLDFCDGTLARMTGKLRKTAFRIDHFTDLIKLLFLFVSTGVYFDQLFLWVLLLTSLFIYLLFGILQQELDNHFKKQILNTKDLDKNRSLLDYFSSYLPPLSQKVFISFFSIFFTINGHTLLIFLFLPFDLFLTFTLLIYFSLISLLNLLIVLFKLKKTLI